MGTELGQRGAGLVVRMKGADAHAVMMSILQAGSSRLFAVLSARWLGPTDRGVLAVLLTLGSFLMWVGSLGYATSVRVLIALNGLGMFRRVTRTAALGAATPIYRARSSLGTIT